MSNDGKIYIIVTDKLPNGNGNAPTESKPKVSNYKDEEAMIKHWARNKLIGEAKSLLNTSVNYSLSNIGNFTGDYITQTHVNDAISNLNGFLNIGTSIYAGFKIGGAYGAFIAGGLSLLNTGVTSALRIHSMKVANRKTNYEIEQLRKRSGLDSTMDGSRGTEN